MEKQYLKFPIAIIGASSMVASRFCDLTRESLSLIEADLFGQNTVDITNAKSVDNFFKNNNFASAILFSAFTDVDGAEAQRGDKNGQCWQINVEGVRNVVNACQKYNRKLIFISTDFVFDGTSGPYSEDDPVGKNLKMVSWYGITKIEAEKIILKSLKEAIIIRITYPYRGKFFEKDDILKRILRLALENRLYPMFADQIITPTFIDDLPKAIKTILKKNQNGIFHIVSPKSTTQYDLARKVVSIFGLNNVKVQKGSLVQFLKVKGRTPRPIKGGLKVNKIISIGFTPTSFDKGIKIVFNQTKGKLI